MMIVTQTMMTDWLEDAGYQPHSYSGRAMYGRRCVAVTVAPVRALRVGADLVVAALSDLDPDFNPLMLAEEVADLMGGAREDSMGRDVVVYWPDVEWTGDNEDEEEEDR
jgi:hypothetical protein